MSSNHPTIAALRARLESERENLSIKPFGLNTEPPTIRQSHSYVRGHEAATERLMGLLEKAVNNLEAILKHVNKSTDITAIHAVYHPPAYSLRLAAEELEKKDADIQKAREFLTTLADASGEMNKDDK